MNHQFGSDHSSHLSEDALDDLLLDMGSPFDASHLASCETCAARLEVFRSSMANFNQASSAWSQARSNSILRDLEPRRSRFAILPAWSIAAAFFFAVALSFLVGVHRGMAPRGATPVDSAQNAVGQEMGRQQEIASDNAMLHAIDSAISQPVPSPVEGYGIEKSNSTLARRISPREVRD